MHNTSTLTSLHSSSCIISSSARCGCDRALGQRGYKQSFQRAQCISVYPKAISSKYIYFVHITHSRAFPHLPPLLQIGSHLPLLKTKKQKTGSCHSVERKSRRCWKYLFCFAEPDFTPRQGHQHSAFVTAELQQASLVCGGGVREGAGALLGAAGGGARGRLKSFHPLLALPCGHVHEWETDTREKGRQMVHVDTSVSV